MNSEYRGHQMRVRFLSGKAHWRKFGGGLRWDVFLDGKEVAAGTVDAAKPSQDPFTWAKRDIDFLLSYAAHKTAPQIASEWAKRHGITGSALAELLADLANP